MGRERREGVKKKSFPYLINIPVSYTHLDVYKRQPFVLFSSHQVFRAFPISGGFSLADLSLSERKDKINGNRKNFYLF